MGECCSRPEVRPADTRTEMDRKIQRSQRKATTPRLANSLKKETTGKPSGSLNKDDNFDDSQTAETEIPEDLQGRFKVALTTGTHSKSAQKKHQSLHYIVGRYVVVDTTYQE